LLDLAEAFQALRVQAAWLASTLDEFGETGRSAVINTGKCRSR
jgi:hypothetical protein